MKEFRIKNLKLNSSIPARKHSTQDDCYLVNKEIVMMRGI